MQLTDTLLSTKGTGNISDKLSSIFSIFRYSPSGSHVFQGEIMYTNNTAARTRPRYSLTGQYRIPQNSTKKQIPHKLADSVSRLKISRSVQNYGSW